MKPSVRTTLLLAAVYTGVGLLFAALSGGAGASQARQTWRLAAWVVSAAAFGAHIAHERRIGNRPRIAAFHVSLAAAIGAFALAVAANLHGRSAPQHRPLPVSALVVWPVVMMAAAFVAALAAAMLLARLGDRGASAASRERGATP